MPERFHKEVGYGTPLYEEGMQVNAESVRMITLLQYEEMWMRNIAGNLPSIVVGANLKDYPRQTDKHALVIGYGPSVRNYKQLENLHESGVLDKVFTIACDRALKPCLEAGFEPDLVVTLDGTLKTAEFFRDVPRLEKTVVAPSIIISTETALLANKCTKKQLHWWMPLWDDIRGSRVLCPQCNTIVQTPNSYTRAFHYMTGATILQTLGNVGASSFYTALHLGCNPVTLMGLDYGYPPDTPLEDTQYYKSYVNMVAGYNAELPKLNERVKEEYRKQREAYLEAKKVFETQWGRAIDPTDDMPPEMPEELPPKTVPSCYRYIINEDTQRHILVGLNWDVYRKIFLSFVRGMPEKKRIINVSPESSLFGEGIETMNLEAWFDEVTG